MNPDVDPSSRTLDVLSSEELACRAQAGSLPSYAKLVERFQGRLYNFLLRRVGHADDAEDLAQDTFIRAWERIDRYRTAWRFSTWLYTIGARLAINHHRAGRRGGHAHVSGESLQWIASPADDGASNDEKRESGKNIWNIAASLLSPEQHTMMWLRYVEELSAQEIARVLGRTQISVRVSLHRARERIATAIAEDAAPASELTEDPAKSLAPAAELPLATISGGAS